MIPKNETRVLPQGVKVETRFLPMRGGRYSEHVTLSYQPTIAAKAVPQRALYGR